MIHTPLRVPPLARLAVLAVVFLVWIFSVAAVARAQAGNQARSSDIVAAFNLAQVSDGGRRLPAPPSR